ncbi:MAG: COX15/CtaA family protein [Phycisphaeraceae bacterium]|nr:COX15/CtaA family protein [Phycisphaeraceae bacterium]
MNLLRLLFRPSVLTDAFAATVVVWWTWFVTHLPWLGIPEQVSVAAILAAWLLALIVCARAFGREGRTWGEAVVASGAAGFISALAGLLILGSKLVEDARPGAMGQVSLRPGAILIAIGFLFLGTALGLVGGAIGRFFSRPRHRARDAEETRRSWLGRFGIVAAVAVVPLLIVGGLVTSSNSGMAVPDWPNTYGSNMFLYPIGPRATPAVYLEHSHRLFGALIGLTAIVLAALVFIYDWRGFVKLLALFVLALVISQGILGGMRVLQGSAEAAKDAKWARVFHGVLAQIIFCLFVSMGVFLSPLYQRVKAAAASGLLQLGHTGVKPRTFRIFATAAMHTTLLQLVFGAMYRHTRSAHALWAHMGFSLIVVIFVLLAAFASRGLRTHDAPAQRFVRAIGSLAAACVALQFLLGWLAFLLGGTGLEPQSITEVLLRTAHQANGALLLAITTIMMLWGRVLAPKAAKATAGTAATA